MRKRIGIDIDGVIANTQPIIIEELNKHFSRNYILQDFVNFDPLEKYGINRQELHQFIMERELVLIESAKPMPGAIESINKLITDYQINIISARTPEYHHNTLNWFARYNISFDSIVHTGTHDKRSHSKKAQVQLFIEDNLKNAVQISSLGIPVYLFDATYNQGELPPLVHRKFSWEEIITVIYKDTGISQRGT